MHVVETIVNHFLGWEGLRVFVDVDVKGVGLGGGADELDEVDIDWRA